MKRLAPVLLAATLLTSTLTGQTPARLDQRLTGDRQAVHVLRRLTFGPRPTDFAEIRKLGVAAWIDLQLHPERIPQNPELEALLKPLETLSLPAWQVNERYAPPRPAVRSLQELLTPLQVSKLTQGGSATERREVLMSLAPGVRTEVLRTIPMEAIADLPELTQEAETARFSRSVRRESMTALPPDQRRTLQEGTQEAKRALLASLNPSQRQGALRTAGPQGLSGLPDLRREAMALMQPQQYPNQELIEARLYRAVYSNRQLEEVLVDFWMNHFNIFNGKNQTRVLLTGFERDAIRPRVLGRFEDLLLATARHPAMLIYLDNFLSQAPREDAPQALAPGRRPGINENYGRELLELHTLGVDGGYTQYDVIAVARAFTGWTVFEPDRYAEFAFNPGAHDRKEKVILGQTLAAGRGEQDGLDTIAILARHPSTARFISWKLAQRFVADKPPESLVKSMAATFTKTGGNLRAVLQTLFSSPEFLAESAWQAKMKSPLEFVVSAARALNAGIADVYPLGQQIADMGQPLYGKVDPNGYPNTGEIWSTAAGVLGRINFAIALTANQIGGMQVDAGRFNFKTPDAVARELLGVPPSADTLDGVKRGIEGREATPSLIAAAILGSPEFQRK